MVTFTSPDVSGGYPSYYRTRRTPFVALQDEEVARYNSEVVPVYSDHDARIRGAQSGGHLVFEQARTQSSTDSALAESSSPSRRELQGSTGQALVRRSPSSHRDAQDMTYVFEEHIPAQVYYTTRRTPSVGLHNSDAGEYNREVVPVYRDHDAMIRGAQSEGHIYRDNALVERSSRRRELQSSNDKALSRRCSSCQREVQSPTSQALVNRSSSCSREVQTSGTQRADVQEYIKNGRHTKEYVLEEHIPAQHNYRTPSKSEIMALDYDYDRRAHSVSPKQESPAQLIKILAEPGILYYAPLRSDGLKPWPELERQTYYDNRRAVFTEPRGSELKHYTFRITPSDSYNTKQLRSSSYDNSLDRRRSRSHSREHGLKQQVIYEDVSSDIRQNNMSTARNVSNEMALVPFDRSQSVPPAQQEYSSQWIKIPGGPTTIAVYPTVSSNDPSTWANQEPQRITTYETRKAVDSSSSHDDAVVKDSSQSKKQSDLEIVTYEHFPKPDISLEKREIATDQRYDRSHINNHGSEYRSKWVNFRRGPSPFIYSSIHSLDKNACSNPALTGYVGSTNYLEARERSANKDHKENTQTKVSLIDKNYMANSASSKVNRILNTREDFEKKHVLDMLFNIRHILKEREALGAYEIPFKLRNKMDFLANAVQDISLRSKSRQSIGSYPYPTDTAKSFLAVSSLLAPIRPDHGRTNPTTRFQYMLHEPRVL